MRIMSEFGKIHFSVDDVINSLLWLSNNNAKSIFDSYTFSFAKELYDKYGLITTCNCLYSNGTGSLADVTDKYASQFYNCSSFIRFSFHGLDFVKNYSNATSEEAKEDYLAVKKNIDRITGGNSWSEIMRVHYFQGNHRCVLEWNALCDNLVLLTSDDFRKNYDLTNEQLKKVEDYYLKLDEGPYYVKTDFRLEAVNKREIKKKANGVQEPLVVFTHEKYINDISIKNKMTYLCEQLYK